MQDRKFKPQNTDPIFAGQYEKLIGVASDSTKAKL
jgi:hypothetical protein